MDSKSTGQKKKQLKKPEMQTNVPAEEQVNKQPHDQTDSRMIELTIKQSTECSPVKANEQKNESTNITQVIRQRCNNVEILLTIKQSTECSPVKTNEQKTQSTNITQVIRQRCNNVGIFMIGVTR